MRNLMKFSLLIGMIAVLFLSACKKDEPAPSPEPTPTDNFGVFKQYLIDNSMDIPDVLNGWITTAAAIQPELDTYYVIDIRSAEDFANGHIPGAVNSTLGDILTAAGNSGGSWNANTSVSWPANVGNTAVGHTNWTPAPGSLIANNDFGDPSFQTTQADGPNILAERVAVLLSGMNKVTNTEVLDNNESYFINNFWDAADVEHYGHIAGAFRVKPLSLAGGEYKFLNPASPIVTYCWTGQTSSMVTAYLKVLGYDSKSLLFGTNGMIYDNLESHKWSEGAVMGYPLVTE